MSKVSRNIDGAFDRLLVEIERRLGALERARPEALRVVGASGQPAYTNSWVTFSGSFSTSFYIDTTGVVHLTGRIKSGTLGTAAFTLPAGYRPGQALSLWCADAVDGGVVSVNTTGTVVPESSCSNTWVSLDGISFRAEA